MAAAAAAVVATVVFDEFGVVDDAVLVFGIGLRWGMVALAVDPPWYWLLILVVVLELFVDGLKVAIVFVAAVTIGGLVGGTGGGANRGGMVSLFSSTNTIRADDDGAGCCCCCTDDAVTVGLDVVIAVVAVDAIAAALVVEVAW